MFYPVPYAPEYEVNESGTVRRVDNSRPLKPFKRGKYLAVKLNGTNYSVHRLVMDTFNPVANSEGLDVDHIDYNTENNRLSNLRWMPHRENARRQKRRVHKDENSQKN